MIGIYKITNLVNKKVYIGQSCEINRRWIQHKTRPFRASECHVQTPLYRAFRKHGVDSFKFEIVEFCKKSELNEKEIYWIKFFDSTNGALGYNLKAGGDGQSSFVKLTQVKVDEIHALLKTPNITQTQIAKRFGVHLNEICLINNGKLFMNESEVYPVRKLAMVNWPIKPKKKRIRPLSEYTRDRISKGFPKPGQSMRISKEELSIMCATMNYSEIGRMIGVTGKSISNWVKYYELELPIKPKLTPKVKTLRNVPKNIKIIGSDVIFESIRECSLYLRELLFLKTSLTRIDDGIRRVILGKRKSYLGMQFVVNEVVNA